MGTPLTPEGMVRACLAAGLDTEEKLTSALQFLGALGAAFQAAGIESPAAMGTLLERSAASLAVIDVGAEIRKEEEAERARREAADTRLTLLRQEQARLERRRDGLE